MFGRKSKKIKELEAKIRSLEMDKEWNIIHYQEETQRLKKALDKSCKHIEECYKVLYDNDLVSWYTTSKDLKLLDGTKVKEYRVVFETTGLDLRDEIIKHLQEIMDRESEKQ